MHVSETDQYNVNSSMRQVSPADVAMIDMMSSAKNGWLYAPYGVDGYYLILKPTQAEMGPQGIFALDSFAKVAGALYAHAVEQPLRVAELKQIERQRADQAWAVAPLGISAVYDLPHQGATLFPVRDVKLRLAFGAAARVMDALLPGGNNYLSELSPDKIQMNLTRTRARMYNLVMPDMARA